MKRRIIVALIVFLLLAAFVLPAAIANLDLFLQQQIHSGSAADLAFIDPRTSFQYIFQNHKTLSMYLMSAGSIALLILILLISGTGINSETKMRRITPDIITPYEAGQGQYGTARWMTGKERRKAFSVWKVPKHDHDLAMLLNAGQQDRKEIRHADIQLE